MVDMWKAEGGLQFRNHNLVCLDGEGGAVMGLESGQKNGEEGKWLMHGGLWASGQEQQDQEVLGCFNRKQLGVSQNLTSVKKEEKIRNTGVY